MVPIVSRENEMNNQYQFEEFLHCCREQQVRNIHLAEACLLVNPSSGDFGSIIIEFERCSYFITSKYLVCKPEDEEIDEFRVKKFEQFDELKEDDLTEKDIYKTISGQEYPLEFITEMVDSDGYFNGMEWKYGNGYLFFTVDCPDIVVLASWDEDLKYLTYPHQFGDGDDLLSFRDEYYELFPEA